MDMETEGEGVSLEECRIPDLPASMFYIPNFMTQEEEEYVLQHISNKWISLTHRRLQAVPAQLTATNTLVSTTGLPDWMNTPILAKFAKLGLYASSPHSRANHCLINEYLPGQGIMPHEDGAAYHPIVATVSLSGTLVLDVVSKKSASEESVYDDHGTRTRPERTSWRVLQEPRSLLVTTGDAYKDTLHGIAEVTEDIKLDEQSVANWHLLRDQTKATISNNGGTSERTTRTSLTFRDVLKVSTLGSKIFGKPRG